MWNLGFTGNGYAIAVIDTGVARNHPFLTGKVVAEACFSGSGPDTVTLCPNGNNRQIGGNSGRPCTGIEDCKHGTHVAGIAAGNGATAGVPFSGVAKGANIIAIQVASQINDVQQCALAFATAPCLFIKERDAKRALEHVLTLQSTHNIAAVVMSFGIGLHDSCDDQPRWSEFRELFESLRSLNIAPVVSAGNLFTAGKIGAPACLSSAISVAATTKTDEIATYSNNATFVSLLAPGGDESLQGQSCVGATSGGAICSSVPGNPRFSFISGTSQAAPHVAGAFAVLKQRSPTASISDLLSALQSSGVPVVDLRGSKLITRPRIFLDNVPWIARYGSAWASPTGIVVDLAGNAYVTGRVASCGTCPDGGYVIVKYDPNGQQLWAQTYNGGGESSPFALAVDGPGNVYVTGQVCTDAPNPPNCAHFVADTIKYDAEGNQLWVARYDVNGFNAGTGVAVDNSGNIYLAVLTAPCITPDCPAVPFSIDVVKINVNGQQVWGSRYTRPDGDAAPFAIVVDAAGNAYITGESFGFGPGTHNATTIKYDTNGNQLWVSLDLTLVSGRALGVDASGNVLVTGVLDNGSSSVPPNGTVKYGPNGNTLWTRSGRNAGGVGLALDSLGSVYVTGNSFNPNTGRNRYGTTKYDSDGTQIWSTLFRGSGVSPDAIPTSIGLDAAGNTFVTGDACWDTGCGAVTLKYDQNGVERWRASQSVPYSNGRLRMAVGGGGVYLSGEVCSPDGCPPDTQTIFLTVKYTPSN